MHLFSIGWDRHALRCSLAALGWLTILGVATPARGQCNPQEVAKLLASDAGKFDYFGYSVAVSGDTAVVGAISNDPGGTTDAGAAYVFVRVGGIWTPQATLVASDAATNDNFGYSVAISGDTAVVGAYLNDHAGGTDAGAAYVFVRSGGIWTEQKKLTASDSAPFDSFGYSVAISADTAVVGALYDDNVGGIDAGSAYVFVRTGVTWTQQAKLTASDAATTDQFGVSVSVSGDTAVIGAYADDLVSGMDAGSAYVFFRTGTAWAQQTKLTASDAAPFDQFGTSVAISGDTAVIGAYAGDHAGGIDAGAAYVFTRTGVVWTPQAKLTASDAAADARFGVSVAVSGNAAVVGALADDHPGAVDAGSAYVFVRTGVVWTQQAKLTASDSAANDRFGNSVAISGDAAVVGAYADDHAGGTDAGSAYVFDLTHILHPGDLDGDLDVDLTDLNILVNVLLGVDVDPIHVLRADIDCSGKANGLDIRPFTYILLN
jgi:hypothetical protein